MANVLIATAASEDDEYNRGAYRKLRKSAGRDKFGEHRLVDEPNTADVILFAEIRGAGPYFEAVRGHPYVRQFRERCFLFSANDEIIPFLPGIYASIEARWHSRRTRSGSYLGISENDYVTFQPPDGREPYLFSFIGATENATVRSHLAKLQHPRGFFRDTSSETHRVWKRVLSELELQEFWKQYADVIKQSKFVLCPRGIGASSVRLFDTMKMGRVPVILSDAWVPPEGPDWESFSIRIPENRWRDIPALLASREGSSVEMGLRARAEWEEWFSEESCFHRVVEWCLSIQKDRVIPERWLHYVAYGQFLRPLHLRGYLRSRFGPIRGRWKLPT